MLRICRIECLVCACVILLLCVFQSFLWSSATKASVGLRAPYVLDVRKITFEYLDVLLRRVSEDLDGTRDWPPPAQEKECIAVAALNLLRLQVSNVFDHL